MRKNIIILLALASIAVFLGKNLNPFDQTMFTFHDETQPARIQQFALSLRQGSIPPRVAPDFLFKMGYPVFNFYAPTAYWITSGINLMRIDIVSALKLSFLLALLLAFINSFLLLRLFFDFSPSLFGSFIYITSLYFPVSIFVRGNLSELWFLTLFPLALFLGFKNSVKYDKKIFFLTSFVFFLTLTVHNIYSPLFAITIVALSFIVKNRKRNFFALFFAFLLSSYFWFPAIFEMKYVWAKEVATSTFFGDHFLCPLQLWQSPWGFGGSVKGCLNDGMSFKIGKVQVVFGLLGMLGLLRNGRKYKNESFVIHSSYFVFLTIVPLFMTTYLSQPIWKILSPFLSFVQFPWRFIGLSLIGIAFFSSFFWQTIKIPLKSIVIIASISATLIVGVKYFYGQTINKQSFEKQYLSKQYITKHVAYKIAEYLPKTIDYHAWRSLENKRDVPDDFLSRSSIAPFSYSKQTGIEQVGNSLTLLGFFLLLILFKKGWKT